MFYQISHIRFNGKGTKPEDITHVWVGETFTIEEVFKKMAEGIRFSVQDPKNADKTLHVGIVHAEPEYITAYSAGMKNDALLKLPLF